ncbi:RraA family protein [Subtercola sp. Z020]|uniref:RraA family protein n=1 Tax=Subtercola sp. Z020 TaxID=2080582 RepID=UPI00130EBC1F|nr:RraA family protein [Subtercola sp. Z020]
MTPPLTDETPALDAGVTSAQLSDSLDSIGLRDRVVAATVQSQTRGARIAGVARTVRFEPETRPAVEAYGDPHPYDTFIEFMDGVEPGEVIVVSTGGDPSTAYWGELFSAAAIGRGGVGVICDSFTRDRSKIDALRFPVFSAGTRPIDFRARMVITGHQVPVVFGGVRISPGDLVLGDDDGIVVAPLDRLGEVVEVANARAATESAVLEELLSGSTIGEVWKKYRTL